MPKIYSNDLMLPGSHTIGTTLASFFYYLSKNPAVYARATQEVRKTFATKEEIVTGPLLRSCAYLQACIDETLRKSPPNAVPLWRDIQEGGAIIDGTFLPAGTTVGVAGYSLHHNDKYFANPATFDPERWMSNDSQEHVARRACAPFSIGPRSCMGKSIALAEVMLTTAHILWALDFKCVDRVNEKDGEQMLNAGDQSVEGFHEFKLRGHFISVTDGPMIQFKPFLRQ